MYRSSWVWVWVWGLWLLGYTQSISLRQHAFSVNDSNGTRHHIPQCPSNDTSPLLRVAIVGAGPSGTSAAYFLSTAQRQLAKHGVPGCETEGIQKELRVTVYEREERVGGRVLAVHPLDDPRLLPVDIGASIFANANHNLVHAAKKFHLRQARPNSKVFGPMGLWDGQEFLVDDFDGSRWSQWKLYWRYGKGPQKALSLVEEAMKSFQRIYSPRFLHDPASDAGYPWPSVAALAKQIEARELVSQSARTYFADHKVSEACMDELINAATRANYAQEIQNIHAFAGLVSMATNGPNGVQGGNAQIFEHMLHRSNATVYRAASGEVTGIMKIQSETTKQDAPVTQWRIGTRDGHSDVYDVVLIAAPWHSSDITLLNTEKSVPGFRYQRLYVTLVVTDAPQPDPVYFGFDRTFDRVPRTIVTTHLDGDGPDFLSLSYQRRLKHAQYDGRRWDALYVVKLFSWAPLPSKTLNKIFGNGQVVWTHEKVWSAFPKLTPTDRLWQFEVDTNLYNVNAMERLVSTMETSTLAAKNVVGLVLQKWLGSNFVHGARCKWTSHTPDVAIEWDTWGCQSS